MAEVVTAWDKIKTAALIVVIGLIAFFAGKQFFSETVIIREPKETIIIDTTKYVFYPFPVTIRTNNSTRIDTIIPQGDTVLLMKLLAERDSLSKELATKNLQIISTLDTTVTDTLLFMRNNTARKEPINISLLVKHWELKNSWLAKIGFDTVKVDLTDTTRIQIPDVPIYENPIFTGVSGFVLGVFLTVLQLMQ